VIVELWETVRGLAYWTLLFVAVYYTPPKFKLRDRLFSRAWKGRTDP
jgi:hypothetical protein